MIDPELLDMLVCPVDHGNVTEEEGFVVCSTCGRRYPVTEGIPVMLVDAAEVPQ